MKMSDGLILQPVLLAPERQLLMVLGAFRRLGPPLEVLLHQGFPFGIILHGLADFVRPLPLPLILNQAQQAARQRVGGIGQDRQPEVLDSLGREPVCFAPERQTNLGIGIATRLFGGGLVGGKVAGRATRGRVLVAQNRPAKKRGVDHGAPRDVRGEGEANVLEIRVSCFCSPS